MLPFLEIKEMFNGLLRNEYIRIAFAGVIIAQFLKIMFYYLKHKKFDFRVLVQAGGMPSSHTSMVMALTTAVGIADGWDSVAFAIAVIFSIIVMYDAAGVRRAAGRQAKVLNIMMEDFFTKRKIAEYRLKELLGHTPLEVVFGCLLGVCIAFGYYALYKL